MAKKTSQKTSKKENKLWAEVFSLQGEKTGKVSLSETVFLPKPNEQLIAQAVRVFLANQRRSHAKTKKRGEVKGSTRKIWAQKGTGRARHGDRYAPIFVGGGVAHGPTGKENWHLQMPKKMKRKALFSALGDKAKEGRVLAVSSLEKIQPKTKAAASLLAAIGKNKKEELKKVMIITEKPGMEKVKRAFGNLPTATITDIKNLNTYQVVNAHWLLFQKKALEVLNKTG